MEKAKGDAAIDAAAEEDGDLQPLSGHRAFEIGLKVERTGGDRRDQRTAS